MLLKREEADILSIIKNIISKDSYEYNFYDYIRYMCKDKSLSNEFIYKMLSKMDYNSIKQIIQMMQVNTYNKQLNQSLYNAWLDAYICNATCENNS